MSGRGDQRECREVQPKMREIRCPLWPVWRGAVLVEGLWPEVPVEWPRPDTDLLVLLEQSCDMWHPLAPSSQHWVFSGCRSSVILTGMCWCQVADSVCVFLTACAMERHSYVYLTSVYLLWWGVCEGLCPFLFGLFTFLLSFLSFSYILDSSPVLDRYFANIFSHLWHLIS